MADGQLSLSADGQPWGYVEVRPCRRAAHGQPGAGQGRGAGRRRRVRLRSSVPVARASLRLGRQNLHLFRFKNTRFDVIGGAFYFLMVVRYFVSTVLHILVPTCWFAAPAAAAQGLTSLFSHQCILYSVPFSKALNGLL